MTRKKDLYNTRSAFSPELKTDYNNNLSYKKSYENFTTQNNLITEGKDKIICTNCVNKNQINHKYNQTKLSKSTNDFNNKELDFNV